jgi:hypothetical protein
MDKVLDKIWDGDTGSDLVDWLVLTAGLVMLGIALIAVIDTSAATLANDQMNVPAITQAEV